MFRAKSTLCVTFTRRRSRRLQFLSLRNNHVGRPKNLRNLNVRCSKYIACTACLQFPVCLIIRVRWLPFCLRPTKLGLPLVPRLRFCHDYLRVVEFAIYGYLTQTGMPDDLASRLDTCLISNRLSNVIQGAYEHPFCVPSQLRGFARMFAVVANYHRMSQFDTALLIAEHSHCNLCPPTSGYFSCCLPNDHSFNECDAECCRIHDYVRRCFVLIGIQIGDHYRLGHLTTRRGSVASAACGFCTLSTSSLRPSHGSFADQRRSFCCASLFSW